MSTLNMALLSILLPVGHLATGSGTRTSSAQASRGGFSQACRASCPKLHERTSCKLQYWEVTTSHESWPHPQLQLRAFAQHIMSLGVVLKQSLDIWFFQAMLGRVTFRPADGTVLQACHARLARSWAMAARSHPKVAKASAPEPVHFTGPG